MQIHRINLDRPRLTRNRKVQACQQCRATKVKCDRAKPSCHICTANNRVCVYRASPQGHSREEHATVLVPADARPSASHIPKAIRGDLADDSPVETTHRSRYISGVSWLCALSQHQPHLPARVSDGQPPISPLQAADRPREDVLSPAHYHCLFSPQNTDALIDRYEKCCHVWYPVVSPSEMRQALAISREVDRRDSGSAALTTAICYIASKAAQASGHSIPSLLACEEWQAVAQILLDASGYPSKPSLHNIRAAFLLAASDVTETNSHLSVAPVCVLVRAAHLLGLHRDPSAYIGRAKDAELHRTTWWAIQSLDVSYAVAHGLPPITRPGGFDVQPISPEFARRHQLFATISRVNTTICTILEDVYGIREPTRDSLELLDRKVDKICAEETAFIPDLHLLTASERFAAVSRRACCWKLKFILHQPYLRSKLWPKHSRSQALHACQQYINDFLVGVSDPTLTEYRWVFDHFNVFHACAIILRDLIQYAGSAEVQSLQETVLLCFAGHFVKEDPNWERLRTLQHQAWYANAWPAPSEQLRTPTDITSWSFLCDPVFLVYNWGTES